MAAVKIYGVARSRASRNIWLMNELGQPLEIIPVIQANRLPDPAAAGASFNTRSAEFMKINPNGQIPVMDDNGLVLTESLAINLYLAKKFGGPLAPGNAAEDGLMTMWALWAAAEAEPHAIQVLYNIVGRPQGERDPAKAAAAVVALAGPFAALDRALAGNGHLVGGRFTVADINAAEVIRYALPAPQLFAAAPNVQAWLAACHARPAFKAMMAARLAEPE